MTDFFTLAFVAALLVSVAIRIALATRQVRHVALHSAHVPTAYAASVGLADHQKAASYTIAKTRLGMLELALGTALLLGWTLLGGLQWLNAGLLQWLGAGMAQQMALVVAFTLIGSVLDLPLSLYATFALEQRFGFNKTTWQLWLKDAAKGMALGAALGLPLLWLMLYLMGAAGALWWLWAFAALVVFQLFVMWIAPTFIMPLFNKFTPLEDESVKTRVSQLMAKCGFKAKGFYVMDGSTRSAHSNAFFTGFGNSKRVVFFDTLLAQLTANEMQAVLAHELGHFKHKHIPKRMLTGFAFLLAGLALLGWLSQKLWFFEGLGVTPSAAGANDAIALVLFTLALPVFMFLTSPWGAYFSRRDEFQADAYAVSMSSAADLQSALLKLYKDNAATLTPDPWFVAWYYSHPPASIRLARMMAIAQPAASPLPQTVQTA